jgi:hypothetical protein
MFSSFDRTWYSHYWYIVMIAIVVGILQFVTFMVYLSDMASSDHFAFDIARTAVPLYVEAARGE